MHDDKDTDSAKIEWKHVNSLHGEPNSTEWVIQVKIRFSVKVQLGYLDEQRYELPLKTN
jgi:hypothetical protein